LEPRDKHRTRNVSDSVDKNTVGKGSASSPLNLPNIVELIEEGQITVGVLRPVWSIAATAHDGHNSLAMLVRRKGETLVELLTRLDLRSPAQTEGIFTDEVNASSTNSKHR
jgi:hypothetical protein